MIAKNSPTIATTLSEDDGGESGRWPVNDSSTLTGATATAGGSVTYTVYTNSTCTTGARGAGTKTVTNHLVPDSDAHRSSTTPVTSTGRPCTAGDANNNGATSTCTEEHLVVGKDTPVDRDDAVGRRWHASARRCTTRPL